MTPERADLDALLESIAARRNVDWDRAEAGTSDPAERARVRALRDVSRLAEFHRSLQHDVRPAAGAGEVGRWGDLLLLERVGAGAHADVFRAWDATLQREVALKLLRTPGDGTPGWLEEARTLARLHDPHVVAVYGAAEHDGRCGLWMEFLHGPTLEAEIARRGALAPSEVARLGATLARALATVHAAGALHRDVKPSNVILEREGRAVLTDFGLGRRAAHGADAGAFSGTPLFMSPERLAGAAARPSDDVYALGATLRWALTGAPPFAAATLDELRQRAAAGPTPAIAVLRPDAPPGLAIAIERALAPRAESRYAGAAAMAEAFERAASELAAGDTARPAGPMSSGGAPRTANAGVHATARGRIVAASLVLALVALAAWFAWANRSPKGAPGAAPSGAGATAATPSIAAPSAPAGAYDVSADFIRRGRGGDTPLAAGDRVAPGDRLSLRFSASRPLWVYVLDADDRGECYLLFPQPLFEQDNPLPANGAVMLPGTSHGQESAWTVTSRGGREHFLVVAAPEPVAELEAELASLPAPVPGHAIDYAKVDPGTMERLRGVGGVSPVPATTGRKGPAAIFERIQALAGREQGVHGTWARQIVLENPLR